MILEVFASSTFSIISILVFNLCFFLLCSSSTMTRVLKKSVHQDLVRGILGTKYMFCSLSLLKNLFLSVSPRSVGLSLTSTFIGLYAEIGQWRNSKLLVLHLLLT